MLSNYRKQAAETALKKSYSLLTQMLRRSEADNGPMANWDWPSEMSRNEQANIQFANEFYEKYFAPYAHVVGRQSSVNNDKQNFNVYVYGQNSISWFLSNGEVNYWRVLPDGTSVMFKILDTRYAEFYVVLPGSNKKSRLYFGRDVFRFVVVPTASRNYIANILPGGMQNEGWTCDRQVKTQRTNFINGCVGKYREDLTPANFCTLLVYCNNWKFPDDYPVKF